MEVRKIAPVSVVFSGGYGRNSFKCMNTYLQIHGQNLLEKVQITHIKFRRELRGLRYLSQITKQLGYLRGIKTVVFSPHSQIKYKQIKCDFLNSNTFIYEWCWALDVYTQLNNIIGKQSKLFQFKFMN
ncbi:Hypothetical_protein [Hexamita inflata]|uniref:Hypothetical_protein n=1 Tax=Hexamita inflata TaxID=28002 RepID=A0ABP1HDY1_9EUKA